MHPAHEPIIHLMRVTKTYHRGDVDVPVLQSLDLEIEAGEFLALMGPSGSGKSTILNLVSGIDSPTSGRVIVAGVDLAELDGSALASFRSRHIGFIFQSYNLLPVLNAIQNAVMSHLLT